MKYLIYGFAIFGFLAFPCIGCAQGLPPIVFSEINWGGSSLSTADEWIELSNQGSESVDIGGWILAGLATSRSALTLAEGTVVPAEGMVLIANYELGNEKTTLLVSPSLVTSSLSIPNTDLDAYLAMPDGTVIDEIHDTNTPDFGATDPPTSMERNLTTLEWISATTSVNLTDPAQFGTPGIIAIPIEVPAQEDPIVEPMVEEPAAEEIPVEVVEAVPEEIISDPPIVEDIVEEIIQTETIESVPAIEEPSTAIIPDSLEIDPVAAEETPSTVEEVAVEPIEAIEEGETEVVEEILTVSEEEIIADAETIVLTTTDENTSTTEVEVSTSTATTLTTEIVEETIVEEEIVTQVITYNPKDIVINEVVSDPSEGSEWVEVTNPASHSIKLNNWILQDAAGKKVILPDVTILPNDYYVIENIKMLNNDGDIITLIDPNEQTIDTLNYGSDDIPAPEKGESMSLGVSGWFVTQTMTPGSKNNEPAIAEPITDAQYETETNNHVEETDLAAEDASDTQNSSNSERVSESLSSDESPVYRIIAVAEAPEEKEVTTTTKKSTTSSTKTSLTTRTGVVTVTPATFGDQIAYIDGIQLYSYYANWPIMNLGDRVEVTGTLSEAYGEDRLKISSADAITVLESTSSTPEALSIGEAKQQDTGSLVTITGEMKEKNGNELVIQNGEEIISVVAHEKTNVSWSEFEAQTLTITGIIRQMSGEARLYPRSMEDIQAETVEIVAPVASINSFSNFTPWIGSAVILGVTSMLLYWYVKNRQIHNLNSNKLYV
ncbi:MAG: lamin tail domain-containing protein [Patescibacteria group bacterium]|jgi:hypothetical protein